MLGDYHVYFLFYFSSGSYFDACSEIMEIKFITPKLTAHNAFKKDEEEYYVSLEIDSSAVE